MPTTTPDNSQLDRPYPSDPVRRYRQGRVGQPQIGTVRNTVLTVTLNATGGVWLCRLINEGRLICQDITYAQQTVSPVANAATMQAFAEGQVGVGNVTVTGGPGASGGGTPYVFTFGGELAGQRILAQSSNVFMTGGAATETVVETTRGGVTTSAVPIGPTLGTALDANPSNSPRAREDDPGFT